MRRIIPWWLLEWLKFPGIRRQKWNPWKCLYLKVAGLSKLCLMLLQRVSVCVCVCTQLGIAEGHSVPSCPLFQQLVFMAGASAKNSLAKGCKLWIRSSSIVLVQAISLYACVHICIYVYCIYVRILKGFWLTVYRNDLCLGAEMFAVWVYGSICVVVTMWLLYVCVLCVITRVLQLAGREKMLLSSASCIRCYLEKKEINTGNLLQKQNTWDVFWKGPETKYGHESNLFFAAVSQKKRGIPHCFRLHHLSHRMIQYQTQIPPCVVYHNDSSGKAALWSVGGYLSWIWYFKISLFVIYIFFEDVFSSNESLFWTFSLFIKPSLFIHTFPTYSHGLLISAYCRVLGSPFRKKNHYAMFHLNIRQILGGGVHIFLFNHPPSLPQVLQRLRLSNRDEDAALRELLRLRRAQCEGRGNWKHCPPQSPPLPPTLLWTNRKASPWWAACPSALRAQGLG